MNKKIKTVGEPICPKRIFASTGAKVIGNGDNIEVGVTAHCECGKIFTDDIKVCNTRNGRFTNIFYDKYGFPIERFMNKPFKSAFRIFCQALRGNLRIKFRKK